MRLFVNIVGVSTTNLPHQCRVFSAVCDILLIDCNAASIYHVGVLFPSALCVCVGRTVYTRMRARLFCTQLTR